MSSILAQFEPSRVVTKHSKTGRITAQVLHHTGDASTGFGTLRAQGKAKGLSGSALKEWIYSQASGDRAQAARTEARVLFNLALDRGHVPQRTEVSQSSGNMVFRLIPEAKAPATKTITCQDPAAMVASMTPEQRAALLAALQA